MNKLLFEELRKFKNEFPEYNIGDLQPLLDLFTKEKSCNKDFSELDKKIESAKLLEKGFITNHQITTLKRILSESKVDLIISGSLALALNFEINRPIGDFDFAIKNQSQLNDVLGASSSRYFQRDLKEYDDEDGEFHIKGKQFKIDGVKFDVFVSNETTKNIGGCFIVKSTENIWNFKKQMYERLSSKSNLTQEQRMTFLKHKTDLDYYTNMPF